MQNQDSRRPQIDELNRRLLEAVNDYQTLLKEAHSDQERESVTREIKESLARLTREVGPVDRRTTPMACLTRIIADHGSGQDEREGETLDQAVRIDHLAIAVRDLDDAIRYYTERYGFRQTDRRTLEGSSSAMEYAVMAAGDVTIVLVMGRDVRSNVSKYVDHYGPGVQHVAIQVRGLKEVLTHLTSRNADMLTGIIRGPGLLQAFTRRERNSGMQFEFIERTDNSEFDENSVKELYDAMDREEVY